MTITELRARRARTFEAAKAFLDSHRNADGCLSAEDDATYTSMENEITTLGNEISRLERLEAMDREMSMPTSAPLTEKPASAKTDDKTGRASDTYHKAFWNQLRSKNPMTPEMRNALEEGEVAEGGYLVPDTFENTLIQGLTENGVIRAHARVITTSGGLHKIPVVASHGSASWIDEEGDYYLVEMQKALDRHIKSRLVYYVCRLVDHMGKHNHEWHYNQIKRVYAICLMDFTYEKDPTLCQHIMLRSKQSGAVFSDILNIITLQIPCIHAKTLTECTESYEMCYICFGQ